MISVLIVDDDPVFIEATCEILRLLGHSTDFALSVEEGLRLAAQKPYDLAILDIILPDGSGFQILDTLKSNEFAGHIAIVTGSPSLRSLTIELLGSDSSYLTKPIDLSAIRNLITRVEAGLHRHVEKPHRYYGLVGSSPEMQAIYGMIERVAPSRANVMILGESGVGKELVAKAIHLASRARGPFIGVNCGAISRELIGSELFGHEKGAFTGAFAEKAGVFERAQNGTLFLDEVTEMPMDQQASLLRVLETGQVTRVGGRQSLKVNCRVISASNRSLEEMAEGHHIREDIYFRLASFPLPVPPLRQRREDIPQLVSFFLDNLNAEYGKNVQIRDEELETLKAYSWPGNVRELGHVIHRAVLFTPPDARFLTLPNQFASPFARKTGDSMAPKLLGMPLKEAERHLILATLGTLKGDKKTAAEILGISLKTLYNRLHEYKDTNPEEVQPYLPVIENFPATQESGDKPA